MPRALGGLHRARLAVRRHGDRAGKTRDRPANRPLASFTCQCDNGFVPTLDPGVLPVDVDINEIPTISLPAGGDGKTGIIEIKAAWRLVPPGEEAYFASRYKLSRARLPEGGEALVALIALHIAKPPAERGDAELRPRQPASRREGLAH